MYVDLKQMLAPYSPPETNFLERVRYWSVATPDRPAYRFLDKGEDEFQLLTFSQLDERARSVAANLVASGFAGKRALLMYPPGLDFIVAFFGCHYAGVTAVPGYPPRRNRNMNRINSISVDAEASVVLTVDSILKRWQVGLDTKSALGSMPWLATDKVPLDLANDWINPKISPDDLAIIQYTSGSTGSPKGVMLSHQNLIANCRLITRAFEIHNATGAGCSWLPVYHDMGLIGGAAQLTLLWGRRCIYVAGRISNEADSMVAIHFPFSHHCQRRTELRLCLVHDEDYRRAMRGS